MLEEGNHMCKKLLIGLLSLVMVGLCGGIGQAAVVTFVDTQALNSITGVGTYTYFHGMPADYSAPPGPISAGLEISYGKGVGLGSVFVNGEYAGSKFVFNFSGIKDVGFDVSAILDPWTLGTTSLKVDLFGAASIDFLQSVLTLVYNSNANNNTAVPEPGALILMGTGLLGLALVGRGKFRK
jgi:hypothetical protein